MFLNYFRCPEHIENVMSRNKLHVIEIQDTNYNCNELLHMKINSDAKCINS